MQCEPATSIITKFGGPDAVAAIVGATSGQVRRWRRPKEQGGTGGAVPHWHIAKLMAAAQERRIRVRAEDFLPAPSKQDAAA
jgi:transposase-like protein